MRALADHRAPPSIADWWSTTATHDTIVVPDGTADIIWSPGRMPWVACPDTAPSTSAVEPGATIVGVQLAPGAVAALTADTATDLVGQRLSARDIGTSAEADRLFADLHDHPATAAGPIIATWAATRIGPEWTPDREVINEIHRHRAGCSTHSSGLSPRQLRRRFAHAMGYGPKFFEKICRLDRFIDIVTTHPTEPVASAAATAGYCDQSHLARDCRQLTSRTPSAFVELITATPA